MEQGGLFLVMGLWVWIIMVYFMEELTKWTYNDLLA